MKRFSVFLFFITSYTCNKQPIDTCDKKNKTTSIIPFFRHRLITAYNPDKKFKTTITVQLLLNLLPTKKYLFDKLYRIQKCHLWFSITTFWKPQFIWKVKIFGTAVDNQKRYYAQVNLKLAKIGVTKISFVLISAWWWFILKPFVQVGFILLGLMNIFNKTAVFLTRARVILANYIT